MHSKQKKGINSLLSCGTKGKVHSEVTPNRWEGAQRRIGITGGIASGKSSVGNFLKEVKNLPVLDADVFAREALEPKETLTKLVFERFGEPVKEYSNNQEITLNRSALAKIIFGSKEEKEWLESFIHPIIINKIKKGFEKNSHFPTIVLIAPLLFEINLDKMCGEIWVVYCSKKQQLERLIKRDKLNDKEAKVIIDSQWETEKKCKLADVILKNEANFSECIKQINKIL
tara:strand:+ start:526 stop:1212 length:687 start_codon:yes stop_codon:yes gene_type:complete